MFQQTTEACYPPQTQDDQSSLVIIRPTPAKPRRRAKSAEVYERVTEVARWLGAGVPDWKVKKQIKANWGVGHRQVMNYMILARKRLVESIGKPVQELRAEAYARYMQVFDDEQAKPADRVRANKGIVELLGLAAPKCY